MVNQRLVLMGPISPPLGGMAAQTAMLYQLLKSEYRVVFIPTNPTIKPSFLNRIKFFRAFIKVICLIINTINRIECYDTVHLMCNSGWTFRLYLVPTIVILKFKKARIIINYRGGGAQKFFRSQPKYLNYISSASVLVVPSNYLKQVFLEFGLKTEIIPNIVTIQDKQRCRLPKYILMTRHLEAIYDIKTAILAFEKIVSIHPDAQLAIAGVGADRFDLEKLVKSKSIKNVKFLGQCTRTQIEFFYQKADIFLNTSIVDNTPNSILEAMATKTTIVSTNVGGIPHLVEHRYSALLFEPQNVLACADALLQVIENPLLAKKLQENACSELKKHDASAVIPQWKALYEA